MKCCEHTQLNQSNVEHPPSDGINVDDSPRGSATADADGAKLDAVNQSSDNY